MSVPKNPWNVNSGHHPKYVHAHLKELASLYSIANPSVRPYFEHLHPPFIGLLCPFRYAEQRSTWQKQDFEFIRVLGKGTFGTVWFCRHKKSKSPCAIKLVDIEAHRIHHYLARLFLEVQLHYELGYHPNIVALYGCFHHLADQTFAIVMEYVEGMDLVTYLGQRSNIPFHQVSSIFHQVLLGVQYCHDNHIIHRDIKAHNILIEQGTQIVKLVDFGAAIRFEFIATDLMGTYHYMAPEIRMANLSQGRLPYDKRIDLWSCGVLLYELVTGDVPWELDESVDHVNFVQELQARTLQLSNGKFANANIPMFKQLIPPYLRSILIGLLKTDPTQRPTIEQLLGNFNLCAIPDDTHPEPPVHFYQTFDFSPMRQARQNSSDEDIDKTR